MRGWRKGVSISNILESAEEHSSPELEYKSQIFWSDIGLLLSLKVVRLRSDIWYIESDMICERPAFERSTQDNLGQDMSGQLKSGR